jgi:hypothetical protein
MKAVFATNTAACPDEFSKKMPGATFANGTVTGALVKSPLVTLNAACVCPLSCHGT